MVEVSKYDICVSISYLVEKDVLPIWCIWFNGIQIEILLLLFFGIKSIAIIFVLCRYTVVLARKYGIADGPVKPP